MEIRYGGTIAREPAHVKARDTYRDVEKSIRSKEHADQRKLATTHDITTAANGVTHGWHSPAAYLRLVLIEDDYHAVAHQILSDRKYAAENKLLHVIRPRYSRSQVPSRSMYNYSRSVGSEKNIKISFSDRAYVAEENEGAVNYWISDHHAGHHPFTKPCVAHTIFSATNASLQYGSRVSMLQ